MPRRCLGVLENPLLPEEGWRKAPGWWEKPSRPPRPSRPAVEQVKRLWRQMASV
jgi:hypothetical protein